MKGPIKGPRITAGIRLTIIAVASIVAEPVCLAIYQASANPTTVLPNMEAAWLAQMTKNFLIAVIPLKDT